MSVFAGGNRIRTAIAAADLLICAVAFCLAGWSLAITQADWLIAVPISAVASWLASASFQGRSAGSGHWIDHFFFSLGLNLLAQYGLAYAFLFRPAPLRVTIAGVVLSIALMSACREWLYPELKGKRAGTLLLGYDSATAALLPRIARDVIGVVTGEPDAPPREIAYLGRPGDLADIVAKTHPALIVASGRYVRSSGLPEFEKAGITVADAAALHESALGRLRWDLMSPTDLLFSRSTNADRMSLAIQSVYTNLIGLALLALAAPLLFVAAAAIAIAGGGPVMEEAECAGFQMVPFRMLRFRTRRSDGTGFPAGKLVETLRLTHLPRLINVVRGEMAFFGPPPVRTAVARRLSDLIPVYCHRFTVKPGILGWSQMYLPLREGVFDEAVRLEYDLYYVKQNSVSLDLEILIGSMFLPRPAAAAGAGRGRPSGAA